MANSFYSVSGNPATGAAGLSSLIRTEFLAIQTAFDAVPAISTTGGFRTIFNQFGNLTYNLPAAPGTLATTADIATETARAQAAEATVLASVATETTRASAAEAAANTARALLAPKDSPVFTTGASLSYTLPTLDSSNQAVSSIWVANYLAANGFAPAGASPVTSVAGRTGAVTLTHADLTDGAIYAQVTSIPPLLLGHIGGLGMSNNGVTSIFVAPGSATDDAGTRSITLGFTFSKNISTNFTAGSGNGGMGLGITTHTSTWYHVYIAIVIGAVDVFFDTTFPPTHAPIGTTNTRRIGSVFTSASGPIASFIQAGDNFEWVAIPADLSNVTLTTGSRSLYTLFAPPGVRTMVTFRAQAVNNSINWGVAFTGADQTDTSVSVTDLLGLNGAASSGRYTILTDTAGRIGVRASQASTTLSLGTIGWTDSRGRDS